ncbi:MAG: PspC domain-containing protein [Thermomicrobiales bacterium]
MQSGLEVRMYENNHHEPSGAPPSSGQSPPDSPEPVQSAGKRLQRSEDQRILLGVCGGLANYFDFDPTIVRIAFVLLAVFGGSGLLLLHRVRDHHAFARPA